DLAAAQPALDDLVGKLAVRVLVLDGQRVGVARVVDDQLALAGRRVDARTERMPCARVPSASRIARTSPSMRARDASDIGAASSCAHRPMPTSPPLSP